MSSTFYCVHLYFTTCTVREAVDEINIMLKKAKFPIINENNCILIEPSCHEADWFNDYNFIFETSLFGIKEHIEQQLSDANISYEIIGKINK